MSSRWNAFMVTAALGVSLSISPVQASETSAIKWLVLWMLGKGAEKGLKENLKGNENSDNKHNIESIPEIKRSTEIDPKYLDWNNQVSVPQVVSVCKFNKACVADVIAKMPRSVDRDSAINEAIIVMRYKDCSDSHSSRYSSMGRISNREGNLLDNYIEPNKDSFDGTSQLIESLPKLQEYREKSDIAPLPSLLEYGKQSDNECINPKIDWRRLAESSREDKKYYMMPE